MREALTVVGFLLIVAFVAVFAAPLYVDWNSWRDSIAARLSDHLGTAVRIDGPVEARLLPQPWLSLRTVTVGDPQGRTRLEVANVEGDVSLAALLRGDVELSNVQLDEPVLTVETDPEGRVEPLSPHGPPASASIDNFDIQGGTLHFLDRKDGQDLTVAGIRLVGEARSLYGPYKADGGLQWNGVPHTLKLATGSGAGGGIKIKASIVPADRPLTLDFDGEASLEEGRPVFDGTAVLARPQINSRGDKAVPEEPWSIAARMKLTPSSALADAVTVQVGPDERALKLTGGASAVFGPQMRIDAMLEATQLELDRLAGVKPDRRMPPTMVVSRLQDAFPSSTDLQVPARIQIAAQGVMLGGQLLEGLKFQVDSSDKGWSIGEFEAVLPGQSRLSLSGDVGLEGGGMGFAGQLDLDSSRASALISWLQGEDRPSAPNAARRLSLDASVRAGATGLTFSDLKLAVDEATVEGNLSWVRLSPDSDAGRIEADLTAKRLDLDALPAAIALVPGGSTAFAEADIKLTAQAVAYAGIEAKSASGRVRAGGKLIALEDVTVNDLGGTSLTANGRIDNVGSTPQGEIRVTIDGRDLTGLARALERSPLPPEAVSALSTRAAALSPASADIVVSFGDARRLTLDGKLGGTVTQLSVDLSGPPERLLGELRLKADSLDTVALLRQLGLSPSAVRVPGRATLQLSLAGAVDGPRRWSAAFVGAGVDISGTGKMTGPFDAPVIDGRLAARTSDVLTPAQLFGISMPAVLPGETAEIDAGFRARGGRLVLDDLTGAVLGMPLSGSLSIDPGTPMRVGGRLSFQLLDAPRLASLAAGSDLSASAADGSAWAGDGFGAGPFDGLAGTVDITATEMMLSPSLPHATDAKALLAFETGSVTLDGLSARLSDGTLTSTLRFTRTALEAALTGRITIANLALDTSEVSGRLDAAVDLQGTGRNPAALVTSLTGGGTLALRQPRFGDLSEAAFPAVVATIDSGSAPQLARIRPLLEDKLSEAPLATGDIAGSLTLAGGVLRLATATTRASSTALALSGSLDLATLTTKADLLLTPAAPGDGLGGPPPTIAVSTTGPLAAPLREVDVSALTAWLTVRSAEREAKKLEALEAERAAREKADEEMRRIEAERQRLAEERRQQEEARRAEEARLEALRQAGEASPSAEPPQSLPAAGPASQPQDTPAASPAPGVSGQAPPQVETPSQPRTTQSITAAPGPVDASVTAPDLAEPSAAAPSPAEPDRAAPSAAAPAIDTPPLPPRAPRARSARAPAASSTTGRRPVPRPAPAAASNPVRSPFEFFFPRDQNFPARGG